MASIHIYKSQLAHNFIITKLKKLKYLRVEFEGNLKPFEIPALRGALVDKIGKNHQVFHNHNGNDGFIYRYPLVQYKVIRNQPALLCLDEGVDEIHHFFQKQDWSIDISGRTLTMKVSRLDMKQFNLQAWDKSFYFNIRNWIALSQKSYADYKLIENLAERIRFLETKLIGNILSFAKGVDWHIEKQVEVSITHMNDPKWVSLKNQKVLGFDLDFSSNVFLPNFIGLGKSVSLGYGTVVQKKS